MSKPNKFILRAYARRILKKTPSVGVVGSAPPGFDPTKQVLWDATTEFFMASVIQACFSGFLASVVIYRAPNNRPLFILARTNLVLMAQRILDIIEDNLPEDWGTDAQEVKGFFCQNNNHIFWDNVAENIIPSVVDASWNRAIEGHWDLNEILFFFTNAIGGVASDFLAIRGIGGDKMCSQLP
jgi:hypothetical protein